MNKLIKDGKSFIGAIFMLGFLIVNTLPAFAQNNNKHEYRVLFNGKDIGWLHLEKNIIENKINLLLTSEIKTRIIFSINVFSKELSTFENGKLVYSSEFRTTNGSTKINKQTKLVDNQYEVFEDGEKQRFKFPLIDKNFLFMYFEEPKNLKPVFWDKKNCFINVTKAEDGAYEMKFSNGNSNRFYYKNGVCTKIKIEHMFYSAEIVYVN